MLGTGYLVEYTRWRSISLLLTAKACALVFLFGATFVAAVPWFVTFAGIVDGLMGLAALAAHLAVSRAGGPGSSASAS